LPTPVDLKNITALHKRVHGVPGMVGSLDCMQTRWKNCPIAWQQSFKGRSKGMSTIVLEAAADYNLWFWHAAYGFSGALNDGNMILALSPLLDRMTNGTFSQLEEEAGVVPFFIHGEPFRRTYFLVDGIYPRYTRFVKAVREPVTDQEKRFTGWQESARKDVERAFGVLQGRFKKAIAYKIHFLDQDCIYAMVTSCLIMHNMCISERAMESCTVTYDPSVEADPEVEVEDAVRFPPGVNLPIEALAPPPPLALIRDFGSDMEISFVRNREIVGLRDVEEWGRLQAAIFRPKGRMQQGG
jgi:hypothetical protein